MKSLSSYPGPEHSLESHQTLRPQPEYRTIRTTRKTRTATRTTTDSQQTSSSTLPNIHQPKPPITYTRPKPIAQRNAKSCAPASIAPASIQLADLQPPTEMTSNIYENIDENDENGGNGKNSNNIVLPPLPRPRHQADLTRSPATLHPGHQADLARSLATLHPGHQADLMRSPTIFGHQADLTRSPATLHPIHPRPQITNGTIPEPDNYQEFFRGAMEQLHCNFMRLLSFRHDREQFLKALAIDDDAFARHQNKLAYLEQTYPSLRPVIKQLSQGYIIIEGLQSAGKSSLFAMLTGFQTEIRGGSASTKQPILYHFKRNDTFRATVQHGNKSDVKKTFTRPDTLNQYLSKTQSNIKGVLSTEVLYVTIYGPKYVNKRVVDFPGDVPPSSDEEKNDREALYKFFDNPFNIRLRALKGTGDFNHDHRFTKLAGDSHYLFKMGVITHVESTLAEQRLSQKEGIQDIFSTANFAGKPEIPLFGVECPHPSTSQVCKTEGDKQPVWRGLDTKLITRLKSISLESSEDSPALNDSANFEIIDGAYGIESLDKSLNFIVFHSQKIILQVLNNHALPKAIQDEEIKATNIYQQLKEEELAYLGLFQKDLLTDNLLQAHQSSIEFNTVKNLFKSETLKSTGPYSLAKELMKDSDDDSLNAMLGTVAALENYRPDAEVMEALAVNESDHFNYSAVENSLAKLVEDINRVVCLHTRSSTSFKQGSDSNINIDTGQVVEALRKEKFETTVKVAKKYISEYISIFLYKLIKQIDFKTTIESAGFSIDEWRNVFNQAREIIKTYIETDFERIVEQIPHSAIDYDTDKFYKDIWSYYNNVFLCLHLNPKSEIDQKSIKHFIAMNKYKLEFSARCLACFALAASSFGIAAGMVTTISTVGAVGGVAVTAAAIACPGARKAIAKAGTTAAKTGVKVGVKSSKKILKAVTKGAKNASKKDAETRNHIKKVRQRFAEEMPTASRATTQQLVELFAKTEYHAQEIINHVGGRAMEQLTTGICRKTAEAFKQALSEMHVRRNCHPENHPDTTAKEYDDTRKRIKELEEARKEMEGEFASV